MNHGNQKRHKKHENQPWEAQEPKELWNHKKLPTGTTEERYKNHNEQKNHDNQSLSILD